LLTFVSHSTSLSSILCSKYPAECLVSVRTNDPDKLGFKFRKHEAKGYVALKLNAHFHLLFSDGEKYVRPNSKHTADKSYYPSLFKWSDDFYLDGEPLAHYLQWSTRTPPAQAAAQTAPTVIDLTDFEPAEETFEEATPPPKKLRAIKLEPEAGRRHALLAED
jgi:hypothetical protein